MLFPFLRLPDGTEIVHSEIDSDGRFRVIVEQPVYMGFNSVECWFPEKTWTPMEGSFSVDQFQFLKDLLEPLEPTIRRLAEHGSVHDLGFIMNYEC